MPIRAVEFRVRIHFPPCSFEHPLSSLGEQETNLNQSETSKTDQSERSILVNVALFGIKDL